MEKRRVFLQNALLTITVTLLLRLVFTAFRVSVSNRVGAECMGLYQLTFAVYNVSVTLATSGVQFAATRLVAQKFAHDGARSCGDVMRCCLLYSVAFGSLSMVLVYAFSEPIGVRLLSDRRTVASLRAFSVSLPFIAASSAVSGYFYAIRKVSLTVVARVLEQLVQIASFFAMMARITEKTVELSCCALVASTACSEIVSALFLLCFYFFRREENFRKKSVGIFGKVVSIAFSAAAGAYLKSGLQTVENVMIPAGFRRYGASESGALSGYGTLCSMVLPILMFPSIVPLSLAGLLIPEFTEAQERGRQAQIRRSAGLSIRLSMLFSLFVSTAFILYGRRLGRLLYHDAQAGAMMEMMAPLIPFWYIDQISDGILKGLGEYKRVLCYSSIDTVVSIIMIYFLVPRFGLYGYISVVYVSTMLNACLGIRRTLKLSQNKLQFRQDVLLPFLAALLSIGTVRIVTESIFLKLPPAMALGLQLSLSLLLFLTVMMFSGGAMARDLHEMKKWIRCGGEKRHFRIRMRIHNSQSDIHRKNGGTTLCRRQNN